MTSSRSCGSVIPETADRKAAAAVEPFAVDTGGGAGQLDIEVEPDDIACARRAPTGGETSLPLHLKLVRFNNNGFGFEISRQQFLL